MECIIQIEEKTPPRPAFTLADRCARRVAIALFNGFALPGAATIVEVFQAANKAAASHRHGFPPYDVCLLSASGGRIASSSSIFVWTESMETFRPADYFHALFVAGGIGVTQALRDQRLLTWLRRTSPRSDFVLALGEGRLLLDTAGLAQTLAPAGSRRRGNGAIVGAATGAPETVDPLETALSVVEEDFGDEMARQISNAVAPPPPTQFSAIVRKHASVCISEKIRESARWLEANGDRPIAIDDAAQVAAMSERNFLRRFKMEMGVTPSDYLLYIRLDMCCRLLLETDLPIDKIARRCGIGSGGRLSKLFRKHLNTTPTEYRNANRPATR